MRILNNSWTLPLAISLVVFLLALARLRLPQLALAAAILCFAVLWLLLNRPRGREEVDLASANTKAVLAYGNTLIARIAALVADPSLSRHARREVQGAAREIHALLAQIMNAIEQDADKREAARLVVADYVVPIHRLLRQYVKLSSRHVQAAREEIEATESTLPTIEGDLRRLFETIHEEDVIDLAAMNKLLERPTPWNVPPVRRE